MIEVEVADPLWLQSLPRARDLARAAAQAALKGDARDDVVILLADDETVRELNERFRGKDTATNVLSFPAATHSGGHLGDIALASGVCAREAAAQGKPLADHLRHLVIHGVLHLLGYDHVDDAEAERMEALERALLSSLGVVDPYALGNDVQHAR